MRLERDILKRLPPDSLMSMFSVDCSRLIELYSAPTPEKE
jgi:hypothetical protein